MCALVRSTHEALAALPLLPWPPVLLWWRTVSAFSSRVFRCFGFSRCVCATISPLLGCVCCSACALHNFISPAQACIAYDGCYARTDVIEFGRREQRPLWRRLARANASTLCRSARPPSISSVSRFPTAPLASIKQVSRRTRSRSRSFKSLPSFKFVLSLICAHPHTLSYSFNSPTDSFD